jgi:hypothetical protein
VTLVEQCCEAVILHVSATETLVLYCCSNADKTAKNADGKTALEVAQMNEQEEVAKLFE